MDKIISIDELTRSINSKCEGIKHIDILTTTIREHDLRYDRDVEKKATDILRDGVLNPIHVNGNRILDGKTRRLCFDLSGFVKKYVDRWGSTIVSAKVYNNLSIEEEDYLDAKQECSEAIRNLHTSCKKVGIDTEEELRDIIYDATESEVNMIGM